MVTQWKIGLLSVNVSEDLFYSLLRLHHYTGSDTISKTIYISSLFFLVWTCMKQIWYICDYDLRHILNWSLFTSNTKHIIYYSVKERLLLICNLTKNCTTCKNKTKLITITILCDLMCKTLQIILHHPKSTYIRSCSTW